MLIPSGNARLIWDHMTRELEKRDSEAVAAVRQALDTGHALVLHIEAQDVPLDERSIDRIAPDEFARHAQRDGAVRAGARVNRQVRALRGLGGGRDPGHLLGLVDRPSP